jgi:hypothetical protein
MNFFRKLFKFDAEEKGAVVFNPEYVPDPVRQSHETVADNNPADIPPAERGDAQAEIEAIRKELKPEKFEKEVKTIEDFIDCLKWNFDNTEDEAERRLLGHQIVKIEIGLRTAGLDAGMIKVGWMENGTLGTYDIAENEISISADLLSDFKTESKLFELVLVHEKIHQEGNLSEGMTELAAEKKVGVVTVVYAKEKEHVIKTFRKEGVDKAISLYDIDDPEKLAAYYFDVELEDIWKHKDLEKKFSRLSANPNGKISLHGIIQKLRKDHEIGKRTNNFKVATEELYDKIGDTRVKMMITDLLKELAKKSMQKNRG